jgi:chemotaxis protein CheD
MKCVTLGVGEFGASKEPGTQIKTYALGSCVAVILFNPATHASGMGHIALPDSSINPDMLRKRPGYFADSGIPSLLRQMTALGCRADGRGLLVKLAGGASIMDKNDIFNIGKRNLLAIKKILWQHGLGAIAEDVGGNHSRTVSIATDDGSVQISCPGRGQWQI